MPSKIHYSISFPEIMESISDRNYLFVTDKNIFQLYESLLVNQPHFVLNPGEGSKNITSVLKLLEFLTENNYYKDSLLIGYGGGMVTDIVGFVASIYKRGVDFIFIPTTLMGMVDAAIGGKNGINFEGYKNQIGVINEPNDIFINATYLNTLHKKHIYNGLAEVIKYGIIYDESLFETLENNFYRISRLDKVQLISIIKQSIKAKWHFYHQDLYDSNVRNLLNFGHTIGHFIESTTRFLHGESVAMGMIVSLEISLKLGKLKEEEFNRIINLFELYNLLRNKDFSLDELRRVILHDKKNQSTKIKYIISEGIGSASILELTIDELLELVNGLRFIRFS